MNGGAELAAGTLIDGRYRLEGVIGGGGFGTVYRARQLDADRDVALKILHAELVRTEEGRRRFEREAEMARRLRHPNTVFLYDYGSSGALFFIAYELLHGRSLAAELDGTTGLLADRVARIAGQLLRALAEAHQLGIVHRDVKPSNVFVTEYAGERDFVKLLDFGIAKDLSAVEATRLTQTGQSLGTPSYMAPEQITGKSAGPAADLYAVGLVMAEMITGAPVYQGAPISVIGQQLSAEPTPLSRLVHEHRFGPLILRATHKDAAHRYASCEEMLAHLALIEGAAHPVLHAPLPPTAPAPRFAPASQPPAAPAPAIVTPQPSHRGVALALGLAGALGVAGLALAAWLIIDDEPEAGATRDLEPLPGVVETAAPSASVAASASAGPRRIRDLEPEHIRAAVADLGYRVMAERQVDNSDGSKTIVFHIERNQPFDVGTIKLTTCRDNAQAVSRAGPSETVDDDVILLIIVSSGRDGARLRKELGVPVATPQAVAPAPGSPPGRPQFCRDLRVEQEFCCCCQLSTGVTLAFRPDCGAVGGRCVANSACGFPD